MSNANVTNQKRPRRRGRATAKPRTESQADKGLGALWRELGERRRQVRQAGRRGQPAWTAPAAAPAGGEEPVSSLGRLYEDVSEDGRLSQPPEIPTRLLELEPAADDSPEHDVALASAEGDPSHDENVEVLAPTAVDEVYDELEEGSVRMPGAGRDETAPAEKDADWLGMDGIVPS